MRASILQHKIFKVLSGFTVYLMIIYYFGINYRAKNYNTNIFQSRIISNRSLDLLFSQFLSDR